MDTCTYVYTYIYTFYIYIYICVYIYTYIHIHVHICVHVYIYIHMMYIHRYVIYICRYTDLQVPISPLLTTVMDLTAVHILRRIEMQQDGVLPFLDTASRLRSLGLWCHAARNGQRVHLVRRRGRAILAQLILLNRDLKHETLPDQTAWNSDDGR